MSSQICLGCGGVIGRDCYNPVECLEISNSNRHYEMEELYQKVEILEYTLFEHGIPLPYNRAYLEREEYDEDIPF